MKEIFVRTILTVLITGAALGETQIANKDPIPTIEVCEALSNPEKYDGKMVQIRDRVYGTSEGAAFVGDSCPGIFVTQGKVWPSAVAWTMPTQLAFIIHPVNFSFDWASSKKLDKKWSKLLKRFPARCLAVTYTGMFESWSKDKARKTDPEGHVWEFDGFGHLNAAPAQLVLKSADDVVPISNCKVKQ
jgi:hypothetical protein